LIKADELRAESIAIPSLASGMFGFPRDKSAEIIIKRCLEYNNLDLYNLKICLSSSRKHFLENN
jgi:O-acetyl-ADP-ribose deacetylase (regulator of RNase III)